MTAQIIEFPMDRVRHVAATPRIQNRSSLEFQTVRPSIRITRIVLFWLLVLAVVSSLSIVGASNLSSAQANDVTFSNDATNFAYVTVLSGDSLWSIAERYAPELDPRDFITKLVALNNLESSTLSPGMQLALPIK